MKKKPSRTKILICTLLVIILSGFFVGAASADLLDSTYAKQGADYNNTNYVNYTSYANTSVIPWQNGSIEAAMYTSILFDNADGLFFYASAQTGLLGAYIDNNTAKWSLDTGGNPIYATPLVDSNKNIYVAVDGYAIFKLNALTGQILKTSYACTGAKIMRGGLATDGTLLFVPCVTASGKENLTALYLSDMTSAWNYTAADGDSITYSTPAVVGDTVYVVMYRNYDSSPLVASHFRGIWKSNGTERFTSSDFGAKQLTSSPAADNNGNLYFGLRSPGDNSGSLFSYYLNGSQRYEISLNTSYGGLQGSPVIDNKNGVVYTDSWTGWVIARFLDNGSVKWANQIGGGTVTTSMLLTGNDRLLVYSSNGNFVVIDALTGTQLFIRSICGVERSTPTIDDTGAAYIPCTSIGYIYKLESKKPVSLIDWSNNYTNDRSLNLSVSSTTSINFNVTADQPINSYIWKKNYIVQGFVQDNATFLINVSLPDQPDVSDSFDDGDYTNNPTWEIGAGTWDASAGYLTKTNAGDWSYIGTPSNGTVGTWNWSMRIGSLIDGNADFKPIATDPVSNPPSDGGIDVYLAAGGQIYVTYYKNGGQIFQDTLTWTPDLYWHDFVFTKNQSGGMELKMDGVSIWSRTETAYPITVSSYITAQIYDVGSAIDNVSFIAPDNVKYNTSISVQGMNYNSTTGTITWNILHIPPPANRPSGYVKDDSGNTISNAAVTIFGGITVYTDSNGFYDFGILADGLYLFTAQKTNYITNSTSFNIAAGGSYSNLTITYISTPVPPPCNNCGSGYIPDPTSPSRPTATPTVPATPIIPETPVPLQEKPIIEKLEIEREAKCLKKSLIFDDPCYASGKLFIINPFNYWVYLFAYAGAFLVILGSTISDQKERDVIVDALIYGTLTIAGIAIFVLLGINMYFLNFILNSSGILLTGASIGLWAVPVSLVFDRFAYKNARKARMNALIAKL